MQATTTLKTSIWQELPAENAHQAARARCYGYDVYEQLLGRCDYPQMLYLLVVGELPCATELRLLNALAVALINPGPREQSVHAAMSAGAPGSPVASWLISALAVSAGRYGGAADVRECMQRWATLGPHLAAWEEALVPREPENIWPGSAYPAGFAEAGPLTGPLVRTTLRHLSTLALRANGPLQWLCEHVDELQAHTGYEAAFSLVASAGFAELDLTPQQGELLYLLLRLPGAGVHALEQATLGHRALPFPPAEKLPVPTAEAAT